MIGNIGSYAPTAYNMTHNNRGNIQKTKEFNEFVNNLDIANEPDWVKSKSGDDYKLSKKLYEISVNSLKDMRKDNLSMLDLFYKNDKPTIWGKAMGYHDNTISETQSRDLKNFLYQNGAIDLMLMADEGRELLDSTELSIDDFKQKWLEWMKESKPKTTIEQDSLKQIDNQKPFKPIQAESKNTQTYDINKDEKFSFLLELQKLERERGIDVLRIMQKLEANGERVFDKKI